MEHKNNWPWNCGWHGALFNYSYHSLQGEQGGGPDRMRRNNQREKRRREGAGMTVLARQFPAVHGSEPFLNRCKRQKQFYSCASSLSETSSLRVLGYSNSLRVIHPDVVVIGLLCEHDAHRFASRLRICVCMCYCTNRCCENNRKKCV